MLGVSSAQPDMWPASPAGQETRRGALLNMDDRKEVMDGE
jgi:hypothetical protein